MSPAGDHPDATNDVRGLTDRPAPEPTAPKRETPDLGDNADRLLAAMERDDDLTIEVSKDWLRTLLALARRTQYLEAVLASRRGVATVDLPASEYDRLRARIERLERALFDLLDALSGRGHDGPSSSREVTSSKARARAALEGGEE